MKVLKKVRQWSLLFMDLWIGQLKNALDSLVA
jgi:hypothetical protein